MTPDSIRLGQRLWWRDGVKVVVVNVLDRDRDKDLVMRREDHLRVWPNPSDLHEDEGAAWWSVHDEAKRIMEEAHAKAKALDSARIDAKNAAIDLNDRLERRMGRETP